MSRLRSTLVEPGGVDVVPNADASPYSESYED